MASEEAQFVARAERLAGPAGIAGFQPAAARDRALAAQNRYVVPEFTERTPYGMKTQNPYTRLFDDPNVLFRIFLLKHNSLLYLCQIPLHGAKESQIPRRFCLFPRYSLS